MQEQLARLLRYPIVTFGVTAVMVVASALSVVSDAPEGSEAREALDAARTFYEQNAEVGVSERNRQLLGPGFVDVVATAYEKQKDLGAGPVFSARMQDRTQRRFEKLADAAFEARMREFPAWRHGVSGAGTPPVNHLSHAFVHASVLALAVSLAFFVVAGIGLEMAWGSAVFAGFCLLGTLLPALAFRFVDSHAGIPLAGSTGLVSAVLGAYLVRGLGGHMPLPGWALLPAWAFVELFFVRGIWIENFDSAPLATIGAGVGTGVTVALAMRWLGLEARLADRAGASEEDARNPALGIAERAIEMGNVDAAWKALSEAHAEAPRDEAVSLAFWQLACDQGRVDEAVSAIGPVLIDRLRRGATAEAVGYWKILVESGCRLDLAPAALVKLGEGLLDDGHPEIALDTLGRALDHEKGLPTALAQRVVRVARDLDPGLTHRAAAIALSDPQLDPATRESLEALADEVRAAIPAEPPPRPAADASEAPVATGSPASEATRYPIDSDIDLHGTDELTDPEEFEAMNASLGAALGEPEEIDPNALSLASLERELAGDLGLDDGEELTDPEAWNDPGLRTDLGAGPEPGSPELFDRDALAGGYTENAHLEAGALSADALSQEPAPPLAGVGSPSDTAPLPPLGSDPGGLGAVHANLGRPAAGPAPAQEPALPLAPLGTTPLAAMDDDLLGGPSSDTAPLGAASARAPAPPVAAAPAAAPAPPASPATAPGFTASPFGDDDLETDLDIGTPVLRSLKLVVGVPIGVARDALEVEVEGRGTSRVPFDRIEAVAVAAVAGLSDKPVLIIDLVLNWLADPADPLKVVRFHSNRFNPMAVVPSAGSAVEALKRIVAGTLKRSGALPLPDASAVAGAPFTRYRDAATYEREVLGAKT